MDSVAIIGITGTVLAIIGTWSLFFLNQIRKAQVDTNSEIKEMNKDIRDILVKMSKHDEQVISISQRIDNLYTQITHIEKRMLLIERTEN